MSKKHFVTFCNKKYMSPNRIIEQAKSFNIFDEIKSLNEFDIKDYYKKHIRFIASNPIGFGLWIWKPKVIYDTLSQIDENDIMVYCDAGFHLNINGLERLKEYFIELQDDKCILTFGTSEIYHAREYVKMDAIMNYYPEMKDKLDISCYAGLMIIKKNVKSMQVIKEWVELCENYNYIDRNRSIYHNEAPFFQGNDCDNGLFNMCIAKHKKIVKKILPDETNLYIEKRQIQHCPDYANKINNLDWTSLDNYPFHCRRMTPKFGC